jgi:dolichyl-phosphate beta-glucosyltransferase
VNNQINIGVVVPCYNEEKRLDIAVFKAYINQFNHHVFCFVNDGSSDQTKELLDNLKIELNHQIEVVHLPNNSGKAEAVRQGLLHLLSSKKMDFMGYMDADLATPLEEIHEIENIILQKNKSIVFGSRIIHLGAKIKRKFMRYFLGRVFATIVSQTILKLPIYDTQCGFKFFSTELLPAILNQPFQSKWFFDIEIFQRIAKNKGRQYVIDHGYEYFLNTWEDKGDTKLKISDFIKTPFELIKLKMNN